jgi:DNA-binding IclR family transcriptional regulator
MSPLEDLPREAGLAASLFVRTGISRAVIARVEGSNPLRYELPIGNRLPLHVGAGKVLAAHLPRAKRRSLSPTSPPS